MAYDSQKGPSTGQKGPSYPNLSKDSNPLQTVRDTYRQPQEDSYQMDKTAFMPQINNNSKSEAGAKVGQPGMNLGSQNRQTLLDENTNMHARFVSESVDSTEGRK